MSPLLPLRFLVHSIQFFYFVGPAMLSRMWTTLYELKLLKLKKKKLKTHSY